uniref:Uncharacterized protein n=1 Tax=Rhizophora mucronata TaxID=61149 RepID=A0A2P2ND68_RHIMU
MVVMLTLKTQQLADVILNMLFFFFFE